MKNRRKKKRESGQAMVEFALVLPIFLLLVMGILDFGFLFLRGGAAFFDYSLKTLQLRFARSAALVCPVSHFC